MRTYLLASLAALALATTMYGQVLTCRPFTLDRVTGKVCQGCLVTPPAWGTSSTYVIWPGDVVEVQIVERPDLWGKFSTVRLDGRISLPIIHDVQAAGLTPAELATSIHKKLSAYVTGAQPHVAVSIITINWYPFPSSLRKISTYQPAHPAKRA